MLDENKPSRPEVFFLPPLKMVLSFFDREIKKRVQSQDAGVEERTRTDEMTVTKLIEKLSEKENKD